MIEGVYALMLTEWSSTMFKTVELAPNSSKSTCHPTCMKNPKNEKKSHEISKTQDKNNLSNVITGVKKSKNHEKNHM